MLHFLHIADLHLGMRITRFPREAVRKIQEARFQSLEKVKKLAGQLPTLQFVIVAGDLFDDAAVDGATSRRAFDLLDSFPVPVLIIPGNHDPLQPGCVWDLEPWSRGTGRRIIVYRERQPREFSADLTLYPCPVYRKTSTENPTQWLNGFPRTPESRFRVAIAHGCVMDRPNLPLDDHPISPAAAEELGLDYVALGHWHRYQSFPSAQPRMVYPGVHEPMRFAGEPAAMGWRPYSTGGLRDEFLDCGAGSAIEVRIDAPGAAPRVDVHSVAHLNWVEHRETLQREEDFDRLIAHVAEMRQPELTIFRLTIEGQLPASGLLRLPELRGILDRFLVHEVDDRRLSLEPQEGEIAESLGAGLLSQVYEKLHRQLEAGAPEEREVAQRAILLMYRLARQAQEQSA